MLTRLVDADQLAAHLIKQHREAVGNTTRQLHYLRELWAKAQEAFTRHLTSAAKELQPSAFALFKGVMFAHVSTESAPECGRVMLNPTLNDPNLTKDLTDTTAAHAAVNKEAVTPSVDPTTVLTATAEAELRRVVESVSASDLLQDIFARESVDFYRKEWYLEGLTKARAARRNLGAP